MGDKTRCSSTAPAPASNAAIMARAKRSALIALIRDLRRAVAIEASGGEGDPDIGWTVSVIGRANRILAAESAHPDSSEGGDAADHA